GWLGVVTVWNLPGVRTAAALLADDPAASRSLDMEATSVRITLGVGDPAPTSWNGRVELDRGEIAGVDAWRFREGARLSGPTSWESRSLWLQKKAQPKGVGKGQGKGQGLGKLALAKKKALAEAQAKDSHGGPAPPGSPVVPTGVIVRLKAPADATL